TPRGVAVGCDQRGPFGAVPLGGPRPRGHCPLRPVLPLALPHRPALHGDDHPRRRVREGERGAGRVSGLVRWAAGGWRGRVAAEATACAAELVHLTDEDGGRPPPAR